MEGIPLPGDIPLPEHDEVQPPGEIPLPRDSSSTEKDVHVLFQPPNIRDGIPPPPKVHINEK